MKRFLIVPSLVLAVLLAVGLLLRWFGMKG